MSMYNNFHIVGDFNSEAKKPVMVCTIFKICWKICLVLKTLKKPLCIDLILTGFAKPFMNLKPTKTALSDFYKLTPFVLRTH